MDDYLKDMVTELPEWHHALGAPLLPTGAIWVPVRKPFKVGDRVRILAWETDGDSPLGTVVGYQVCHGYLMVWVRPDVRPDWHIRQDPAREHGLFAGIELEEA